MTIKSEESSPTSARTKPFLVLTLIMMASWRNVSAQNCGVSYADEEFVSLKIIGGSPAAKGEFPWQVSIRKRDQPGGNSRHFCGGALLNNRWVLTAAHCVLEDNGTPTRLSQLLVRAGEHSELVHEGTEIEVGISHVYVHPRYVHLQRDVALVRMAKRLQKSRYVHSVCLPRKNTELHLGLNCTISGWGNTFRQGTTSPGLNKLSVPLRPLADCSDVYARVFNTAIHPWHLCGGSPEGFKGVCYGDSGGPYVCRLSDQRWYVIGLASFGSGCAKGTYPDVYTRVSYFEDFIRDTIRNHRSNYRRRPFIRGGIAHVASLPVLPPLVPWSRHALLWFTGRK